MSQHVREELVDAVVGPPPAEVERHLASCAECSAELDRLRGLGGLLGEAPLDPAPSDSLRDEVFLRVKHAETVGLLTDAPLTPEPERALGERVLNDARLGTVTPLGPRKRIRFGVAMGTAAVLVGALVASLAQIDGLNERVDNLRETARSASVFSGVPFGHSMQKLPVAGDDFDSDIELVHFGHDNYRLQLLAEDVPVQASGHHYELWLRGEEGQSLAGSFRLLHEDDITFLFNVGIDPAEYNEVQIIEEPDFGGPSIEGEVVATGWIDPAHVEHD